MIFESVCFGFAVLLWGFLLLEEEDAVVLTHCSTELLCLNSELQLKAISWQLKDNAVQRDSSALLSAVLLTTGGVV